MMAWHINRALCALSATLALAACTTGWQRQELAEPATPDRFENDESLPGPEVDLEWYRTFGSPTLNAAIDALRADNLDLLQARDRIRQAAAGIDATRAGQLPSVDAAANAGRSRQGTPPVAAGQSNAFGLSLSAAYEVDLWGRVAAARDAAEFDQAALLLDLATIEVTLTSTATEAWLGGVYARARRALLLEQVEVQQGYVDLLLHRMSIASATALDVEQQRQQVAALHAQLALLDATESRAGHTFSTLQGLFPDPDSTGDEATLPELSPLPEVGIPADLLNRRPDVVAARVRAEAANARLASAIASRLPSLRLNGSTFVQSSSLSTLFDQLLWSVTAGLTAPLFDGGRRTAEVERNRAVTDERIHAYLDVLITAAGEVENALALGQAQGAFIVQIDAQLTIATHTLQLARDQYREGVSDYLRVLTAIATLQQLQHTRLDAIRQELGYRVQLYRALGGGWHRPESL